MGSNFGLKPARALVISDAPALQRILMQKKKKKKEKRKKKRKRKNILGALRRRETRKHISERTNGIGEW